jgi:hypothetical protein
MKLWNNIDQAKNGKLKSKIDNIKRTEITQIKSDAFIDILFPELI